MAVDRQPDGDNGHRVGTDPTTLRARQLASRSVGFVAGQPGLGPCQRGGDRPQECGDLLHQARLPAPARSTGTTLCGYPDDKWGWAVISGAEIKLDMLSPGSRIGGYVNYGVGAIAHHAGNSQTSPGLFGTGNEIAFGVLTDAVYVNGSAPGADHVVVGRRRVRILLDP